MLALYVTLTSFIATRDRDEKGATATEYALLVVGICLALGAATALFGGSLSTFFGGLAGRVGLTPAAG